MVMANNPNPVGRTWRWLRQERGRRVVGAGVFWGLVAILLVYNFPYFRVLQHANELPRLFQTMAMVEEGRYAIDTYKNLYGYRKAMDVSRSHCLGPRVTGAVRRVRPLSADLARRRCVERYYSNKAPGMSFLAVPVYAALRQVWRGQGKPADIRRLRDPKERFRRLKVVTFWVRLTTAALPAFLFMLLLSYWLRPFVPEVHPRRVAVVAYGLGTLAFTYSVQVMSHQLATSLMFSAFMLVHLVGRGRARQWLLAPAGFLGAAALASDYQLVFAAVPLALYTLWVIRPVGRVVWAAVGALPPIVLLMHYHLAAFGSVFWTGYEFLVARHDAALHDKGFLGITTPTWEAFHGSFLSQDNGLLYFSPWLVPAGVGLGWLWNRRTGNRATEPASSGPSAEWLFIVAVVLAYTYFITSIAFWRGGWQTGPRYVNAMLPGLVLPYGLLLRRVWARPTPWAWALAVGPALASIVIYALIVATFPHFPDKYKFPLFDLVGPLLSDGYVAYNAGWLLGLGGRASLVPYFVALALLLGYLAAGPSLTRILTLSQSPTQTEAQAQAQEPARRLGEAHARRLLAGTLAVVLAVGLLGLYQHWAEAGLRRETPRRLKGSGETYGHFLRRAGGDIRNLWEPPPKGVRKRRIQSSRRPRRHPRRRRHRRHYRSHRRAGSGQR
jgi:hypothetical protein